MTPDMEQLVQAWADSEAAFLAAWEQITQIVRETCRFLVRHWRSLPRAVRCAIVPCPPTIMRKKIWRYARMNC
jgi:hypothetical protein